MITSPLPKEYYSADEKIDKIKVDLVYSFLDGSHQKTFQSHCETIPKEREKEEEEKKEEKGKAFGGSANRTNNYNVAGLNLSAG